MTFRKRTLSMGAGVATAWATIGGCGIDLGEDVAGKPCKAGQCLPGYECVRETNICMAEDELSAGGMGGGQGARAGSGALGATGGTGGPPTGGDGGGGTTGGGGNSGAGGASGAGAGGVSGAGASSGAGGGRPDAGPDAAPSQPDAAPPSVPRPGRVGCQATTCDLSNDFCCVATFPGSDYTCSPTATDCEWSLGCDGDHDCPGSDVCCYSETSGVFSTRCLRACEVGDAHIECTAPQDCSGSEVCCGHFVDGLFGLGGARYDRIECQATCTGMNERILCNDDTDCTNGGVCNASDLYPGITICD